MLHGWIRTDTELPLTPPGSVEATAPNKNEWKINFYYFGCGCHHRPLRQSCWHSSRPFKMVFGRPLTLLPSYYSSSSSNHVFKTDGIIRVLIARYTISWELTCWAGRLWWRSSGEGHLCRGILFPATKSLCIKRSSLPPPPPRGLCRSGAHFRFEGPLSFRNLYNLYSR